MATPPKVPATGFYEDTNAEEDHHQRQVHQDQDGALAVRPFPRPTTTPSMELENDSDVEYLETVSSPQSDVSSPLATLSPSASTSSGRSRNQIANDVYHKLKQQVDRNAAQMETRIEKFVKEQLKLIENSIQAKIQTSVNDLSVLLTSQVGKLESMISSLDDLKLEPQYPQSRNIMRPANTEELNAARVLDEDESPADRVLDEDESPIGADWPADVSLNSQDK